MLKDFNEEFEYLSLSLAGMERAIKELSEETNMEVEDVVIGALVKVVYNQFEKMGSPKDEEKVLGYIESMLSGFPGPDSFLQLKVLLMYCEAMTVNSHFLWFVAENEEQYSNLVETLFNKYVAFYNALEDLDVEEESLGNYSDDDLNFLGGVL